MVASTKETGCVKSANTNTKLTACSKAAKALGMINGSAMCFLPEIGLKPVVKEFDCCCSADNKRHKGQ